MRRILEITISMLSLTLGSIHAQSITQGSSIEPSFRELGPAPIAGANYTGRISAIACSYTNPGRYFIGGADGGVWRSTDSGAHWEDVTTGMPTTAIGALAIARSNEDVIYAGTGEANFANHSRYGLGVYRSLDGGDSWGHLAEAVFAGRCISSIVVHPTNWDILFAAVTRAGGFPEMAAAKEHPGRTGLRGVFKSTDGGDTWIHLANGLPELSATSLAMDPVNPSVLYVGIGRIFGSSSNGIYKSSDSGSSWSKLTAGLPSGSSVGRVTVAVAPSQPSVVYSLITDDSSSTGGGAATIGGYRSDDWGQTWTSIPVGSIQASYGWYLSVVSVAPTDASTVFMGGFTLRRSTNSGSSWGTVTPPHVDLHALCWDAAGRLLAGDDGGLHRTSNMGGSWGSLNSGLGLIQMYAGLSTHPSDDEILFAGLQDNGSVRRPSDTLQWSQVFGGDGGWTQVDQQSPNRVFVEFQGTGNLYRSTNGGFGFSAANSGFSGGDRNCFLPPYLIDPTDSSRMYYGTHRLYRSTNGGTSWSAISADLSNGSGAIRALAISPSDPDVIWAATNDGNVAVSINGGSNFTTCLSGMPGWPRVTREICVHPRNSMVAWLAVAAFGTDQIRKTSDRGQTWTSVDGDLPDVPVNVVAVMPGSPTRLYAGTDRGVYFSGNGGTNWSRYGKGLPHAPVIDLLLQKRRNRLIVGTQGRGAWSIELPMPSIEAR
ncbi:MAG: photosystem II stability/assembly factor-like uncharacterized protein [Planctomycetota bacterium]|jgi:photosystem II stability/assembly factor-like uncharacterized protein